MRKFKRKRKSCSSSSSSSSHPQTLHLTQILSLGHPLWTARWVPAHSNLLSFTGGYFPLKHCRKNAKIPSGAGPWDQIQFDSSDQRAPWSGAEEVSEKPLRRLELLVRLYTFLWPTKQLQVTGKKTLTFKWWFQYVSMSWSSAEELWNSTALKIQPHFVVEMLWTHNSRRFVRLSVSDLSFSTESSSPKLSFEYLSFTSFPVSPGVSTAGDAAVSRLFRAAMATLEVKPGCRMRLRRMSLSWFHSVTNAMKLITVLTSLEQDSKWTKWVFVTIAAFVRISTQCENSTSWNELLNQHFGCHHPRELSCDSLKRPFTFGELAICFFSKKLRSNSFQPSLWSVQEHWSSTISEYLGSLNMGWCPKISTDIELIRQWLCMLYNVM